MDARSGGAARRADLLTPTVLHGGTPCRSPLSVGRGICAGLVTDRGLDTVQSNHKRIIAFQQGTE